MKKMGFCFFCGKQKVVQPYADANGTYACKGCIERFEKAKKMTTKELLAKAKGDSFKEIDELTAELDGKISNLKQSRKMVKLTMKQKRITDKKVKK